MKRLNKFQLFNVKYEFLDSFCAGREQIMGFDIEDLLNLRQLVNSLNRTPEELLNELC